jgi:hypothetical protein
VDFMAQAFLRCVNLENYLRFEHRGEPGYLTPWNSRGRTQFLDGAMGQFAGCELGSFCWPAEWRGQRATYHRATSRPPCDISKVI